MNKIDLYSIADEIKRFRVTVSDPTVYFIPDLIILNTGVIIEHGTKQLKQQLAPQKMQFNAGFNRFSACPYGGD